ncbi:hypothetical protein EJB05_35372, partial [Eragrostis curvula]
MTCFFAPATKKMQDGRGFVPLEFVQDGRGFVPLEFVQDGRPPIHARIMLNSTAVRALPSVLLPGISPLRSALAGLRATPLPCQRLHDELHLPVSLVALSSAASDWDFRRRQVTDLLLFLMAVNDPLDWIKKCMMFQAQADCFQMILGVAYLLCFLYQEPSPADDSVLDGVSSTIAMIS